jgi:hypothetical protein
MIPKALGRLMVVGSLAALIGVPILVRSAAASDLDAGCGRATSTAIVSDAGGTPRCDDAAETATAAATNPA